MEAGWVRQQWLPGLPVFLNIMGTSIAVSVLSCSSALAQTVTIGPAVFSGSGVNDATSGGHYTAGAANAQYAVTISRTGTPDYFRWSKNGGKLSSPIAITGSAQPITDGVTITFSAITGHTLNDSWSIAVSANGSVSGYTVTQHGIGAVGRNVQDKLSETVSPEDFGARGAPFVDSAACQAAEAYLASINGGILQFQGRTYLCNFLVDSNVWLRGAATGATTLMSAPGSNLDVVQGKHFLSLVNTAWRIPETRGDNFVRITDMTIDGNKAHNSSGYGIRIWGHSMYWDNVTVQNCVHDGIFTQYSDAAGGSFFPSDPKLGESAPYFDHIKTIANGGNGWTYNGPGDGSIRSMINSFDGGWGLQSGAKILQGTINTSGTAMTWVSGSTFAGLKTGDQLEIGTGSHVYTIASCLSSTACTLTTSAGNLTGVASFAVSYLGTIDIGLNWNCYHEGTGCFNFGPAAGIQSLSTVSAAFSPVCIQSPNADAAMTSMIVFQCSVSGVTLGGAHTVFQGTLLNNGVGLILNGVLDSFIEVHGDSNGLAIEDVRELAGNFITGAFDTPASLNDAASGGTYTGSGLHQYSVRITASGTPDIFQWKKDTGAWTTGVSVTGTAQTLADGVTIKFAATKGHMVGTTWVVTANSSPSPSVGAATIERLFLGLPLSNNKAAARSFVNLLAYGADNFTMTQTPGLFERLPVYANNAAAVAGGLLPGTLYRTGGDPDLVGVVH
jgi:hypothetical protein